MASIRRYIGSMVLVAASTLGLAGCGDETTACTAIAVYGINVVVQGATGALVCDAKVEIRQGSEMEVAMPLGPPNDCSYAGAAEKSGTFNVTVTKTGYKIATFDVTVSKDECHVIPQKRTIQLVTQ